MVAPEISLIIRYRRAHTIGRALKSVRDQQWLRPQASVEVIIVDAIGTEDSHRKLCEVEPNLISDYEVSLKQNEGVLVFRFLSELRALSRAKALQAGLSAVRGRFVSFLDDDDKLEANHLEKLYYGIQAEIDKNSRVIAVSTGVRLVRENLARPNEVEIVNLYDMPLEPNRLVLSNALPLMGFICRADALRKCSVDTQLDIYEDWDLLLQLAQLGIFIHLSGITATYFLHSAGSGVHDNINSEEVAQSIRLKWMKRMKNADFERMRHDLALTEQLIEVNQMLQRDLAQTLMALETTRRLYNSVTNSLSWKITGPLRAIKHLGKKEFRMLLNKIGKTRF